MHGLARATMALLQLGLISCMTTLAEDFGDSNDRWRIWVDEVKTGGAQSYASPHEVTTYGSVRYDPEFTRDDYARFMEGLDLDRDEDLWRWSHVTDIPVLAVRKNSS